MQQMQTNTDLNVGQKTFTFCAEKNPDSLDLLHSKNSRTRQYRSSSGAEVEQTKIHLVQDIVADPDLIKPVPQGCSTFQILKLNQQVLL